MRPSCTSTLTPSWSVGERPSASAASRYSVLKVRSLSPGVDSLLSLLDPRVGSNPPERTYPLCDFTESTKPRTSAAGSEYASPSVVSIRVM